MDGIDSVFWAGVICLNMYGIFNPEPSAALSMTAIDLHTVNSVLVCNSGNCVLIDTALKSFESDEKAHGLL